MVCWLAIPESGGHLRLYFVACRAGSCPAPLTARGVPCGGGAAGSCPAPLTARGVPCGGGAAGSCPAPLTARGVPCGGGVLPPCACCVPSLRLRVRSVQKERAGALCPRLVRSACSVVRGQAKGKRLFLDLFNGLCNRPLRHAKIGCNSLVPLALHTQS